MQWKSLLCDVHCYDFHFQKLYLLWGKNRLRLKISMKVKIVYDYKIVMLATRLLQISSHNGDDLRQINVVHTSVYESVHSR